MKAVIIEDEPQNRVQLRKLLTLYCPQIAVIGEGEDADTGMQIIRTLTPDLVFLDIELPGKSGFDMLAELETHLFEVIFVSGYDQYGIQAIKCSALDYLLKPVKPKELTDAVRKAESTTSKKNAAEKIGNLLASLGQSGIRSKRIALPLLKETRFVAIDEIMHCEGANSYTKIYMRDGEELTISTGLFSFQEQLRQHDFVRCHQSHIVNTRYVKSLLNEDNVPELLLTNGTRVPVSRLKKKWLKEELRLR